MCQFFVIQKFFKIVLDIFELSDIMCHASERCGCSSSGRAPPCQGGGSEFEPRHPLQTHPFGWVFTLSANILEDIYMRTMQNILIQVVAVAIMPLALIASLFRKKQA